MGGMFSDQAGSNTAQYNANSVGSNSMQTQSFQTNSMSSQNSLSHPTIPSYSDNGGANLQTQVQTFTQDNDINFNAHH